ncbi:hypothetical protein LTS18_013819 [Coniosporium uncinatum]|uniref:Uncharacterized protein n=1 Tax=Coniosporium uncinatum TaxID=93489 RepID=A0ACC3CVW8_9PEZI|nr:hypothetical protein LTS18_013819 [Coniosporium uncinatum]
MSSYAPSLQNFNWYNWTPNMIAFTANHNETVLSASYWQQKMFATYHGTQTLPVTNSEGDFNPLFWAASIDEPLNVAYLKVINAGSSSVPLTVNMDVAYTAVNGTIMTNPDVNVYNTRQQQHAIVPEAAEIEDNGAKRANETFAWNVPGYSVAVLEFHLA